MEAELVGLAASGATALMGLMVSDAWTTVRGRMSRFLSRSAEDDDESETVLDELEASRVELATARADGDDALAGDVEAQWRIRLRRLLAEDSGAAAELRALLDEVAPPREEGRYEVVHNEVSGGRQNVVVQGRDFSRLTFGGRDGLSTEPDPGER
ncbi:hypothetical protein ACFWBR_27300 [Streptomyces sp. NPDC060006]